MGSAGLKQTQTARAIALAVAARDIPALLVRSTIPANRFRFFVPLLVSISVRFADCVFCLTPCVLNLAFNLFRRAFGLIFRTAGPFPDLTLSSSCDVFYFSLNSIFIHRHPSIKQD